jgi:hypothetical protein
MKYIIHILALIVISTALLSCGPADQSDVRDDDIVVVGGDTLGRNWDNKATKEEAEEAKALGLTPEQYLELKAQQDQMQMEQLQMSQYMDEEANRPNEDPNAIYSSPNTSFSDQMYREEQFTIETLDGRQLVVDSSMQY